MSTKNERYEATLKMISEYKRKYAFDPAYVTVVVMIGQAFGLGNATAEEYIKDLCKLKKIRVTEFRRIELI